jgi:hypothetical protein
MHVPDGMSVTQVCILSKESEDVYKVYVELSLVVDEEEEGGVDTDLFRFIWDLDTGSVCVAGVRVSNAGSASRADPSSVEIVFETVCDKDLGQAVVHGTCT